MKLRRRQFLHLAAGAAALPLVSRVARAQAYPARPVRIIVPLPPGSNSDIVARLIGNGCRSGSASHSSSRTGRVQAPISALKRSCARQPMATRSSRPVRAARSMRRSTRNSISISSATSRQSQVITRVPNVMVVHPSVPAKTVPEFIAYAKANPGKINMASPGTAPRPCGRRTVQDDGRRRHGARALSRRGACADRSARRTGAGHVRRSAGIDRAHQGRQAARACGDDGDASEALPDVPTVSEFLPGYEASTWFGIGAPKSTPTEIIDKLNRRSMRRSPIPRSRRGLPTLGGTVLSGSPADFGKLIADETEKWGKVIRAANIRARLSSRRRRDDSGGWSHFQRSHCIVSYRSLQNS